MWTLIFIILMLAVFGEMIGFSVKAAWGITKVLLYIVFLPIILIGLVFAGLVYVAVPILAIIGVITLIKAIKA